MSKEVVGGLVAIALLAPYTIHVAAAPFVKLSGSIALCTIMLIAYLASVGFFVAMGFKGGETFHNSFWVYWVFGGWVIYSSWMNMFKTIGHISASRKP